MSDTFFSGAPHWTWFIIPYFFVGGLAGGACFLAAVLDWFGQPEDRPVVRTGFSVAFWGAILSGLPLPTIFASPSASGHCCSTPPTFPPSLSRGGPPSPSGPWGCSASGGSPASRRL